MSSTTHGRVDAGVKANALSDAAPAPDSGSDRVEGDDSAAPQSAPLEPTGADGTTELVTPISLESFIPTAVATDANADIFVAGYGYGVVAPGGRLANAILVKYTADGEFAWEQQLASADVDQATAVAVDSEGNAVLSGYTYGDIAGKQGWLNLILAKYSPSGELSWVVQDGSWWDQAYAVAVDAHDEIYLAGLSEGERGELSEEALVAKYSSAGERLWTRLLGDERSDSATGIAVDTRGDVVAVGQLSTAGGRRAFVWKLTPDGEDRWTHFPWDPSSVIPMGVATDRDDSIFVAGTVIEGGSDDYLSRAFVAKLSPTGDVLWQQTEDPDTSGSGITCDSHGNAYFVVKPWLIKFAPDGTELWRQERNASWATTDLEDRVVIAGADLSAPPLPFIERLR